MALVHDPAEQLTQKSIETAPRDEEYVPATHEVHVSSADAPIASDHVPALQHAHEVPEP